MTSVPEPEREPAAEAPERAPYAPPRLTRHGTIEDLTRGGVAVALGDPDSNVA